MQAGSQARSRPKIAARNRPEPGTVDVAGRSGETCTLPIARASPVTKAG
jgi:hypothetical protein